MPAEASSSSLDYGSKLQRSSPTALVLLYNPTLIKLSPNPKRRLSEFQMLNDDAIVTFVQAESDPVDYETDEDEDNNNESTKGPSNAGTFSALETALE
ncbi:hypothetical protein TNCV_164991 [Trichonephila clavipes]|nr:hypothetical protein TNCV_164991 [Trichonephila clavipes]